MRLPALREELKRVLSAEETQSLFDEAKQYHPDLAEYQTVFALLAVLQNPGAGGYPAQERILRALVAEDHRDPANRLWRTLLLYAFLPALIRLRARTIRGEARHDDLDSTAWAAFVQVLAGYPLSRPGSVAAGLTRDTAKLYFKILRREQSVREHERELVAYAELAREPVQPSEPVAVGFNPADHQAGPEHDEPDPDEMAAMRQALVRHLGVHPRGTDDADLVWATRMQGLSVREFMRVGGLLSGDEDADRRLETALWRRRWRAEEALYEAIRGRPRRRPQRPVSSFDRGRLIPDEPEGGPSDE